MIDSTPGRACSRKEVWVLGWEECRCLNGRQKASRGMHGWPDTIPPFSRPHKQGIQHFSTAGGQGQQFTLTDAAICTADGRYGHSDMGATAISAFLQAHSCSAVCTRCGCMGAS